MLKHRLIFLAAAAGLAASQAQAAYLYTFSETGAFFGDLTFTYQTDTLFTADTTFTPTTCTLTNGSPGAQCLPLGLDISPTELGLGGDFLKVNVTNATGFFFFAPGAFGAVGTYSTDGYPNPSCVADGDDDDTDPDCYGNAAQASLTVAEIAADVPEPATWATFIGGFGMVGGAMRRRRRTTVRFA